MKLRQFTLLFWLSGVLLLYILFFTIYLHQQHAHAATMLNQLQRLLNIVTYQTQKELVEHAGAKNLENSLRYVAEGDAYIQALMIGHDGKVLLSTDSHRNTLSASEEMVSKEEPYLFLKHATMLLKKTQVLYQGEIIDLTIYMLLDRVNIMQAMGKQTNVFVLIFAIVPLLYLILSFPVIYRLVVRPLEKLRQFAYAQTDIPAKMTIFEFESIRASMVKSFDSLSKEREHLYRQSRTDPLTGLANRNALEERLNQQIAEYKRGDHKPFALLYIDLDHFKDVNDRLGHKVGDKLLQKVAKKLPDTLRRNDLFARIGGDEFIALVSSFPSEIELAVIAERMMTLLQQTWTIDAYPITTGASIGIVRYPTDGNTIVELMKNADIAMYEAKNSGRSRYYFFTELLNERIQQDIELTWSMADALTQGQFELFYQPQANVDSGDIIGAEALLRWHHPKYGMVSPVDFIPLAEKSGFINTLGEWVLHTAMAQLRAWKDAGIGTLRISVNISPLQLKDEAFKTKFTGALEQHHIDARQLEVEITESVFLDPTDIVWENLKSIQAVGSRLCVDDFGTGYASLAFIRKFPIDVIKIDKSFIDELEYSQNDVFVRTIISMAKTLKLDIIAEGVESEKVLRILQQNHCPNYQGYLCSPPIPADDFAILVARN